MRAVTREKKSKASGTTINPPQQGGTLRGETDFSRDSSVGRRTCTRYQEEKMVDDWEDNVYNGGDKK